MRKILISDFTINEVPHGGSEWVNQVLIENFNLEFEYSHLVTTLDNNNFYIISNISLMNPYLVDKIRFLKNYIIIENDYKICNSRHPWRYENNIIPKSERVNYDLYKNAKAVFVQTTDHLNIFKLNNVEANFINLNTSIWAKSDLELLEKLNKETLNKNNRTAIYNTNNWIKNTIGSIEYCKKNKIQYNLISNNRYRENFLKQLGKCSKLVFLPIARETFCRLVVEAKCLGLDVITTYNYGASLEEWFVLTGVDLIKYLEENTQKNLNIIEKYIEIT